MTARLIQTTVGARLAAVAATLGAALALGACASDGSARDRNFEALQTAVNISSLDHDPYEGAWGCCELTEDVFLRAAEEGYTAVRLPVRFSAHQSSLLPYEIDDEFMTRVEWAVQAATDAGLTVIIDNHHWGSTPGNDVDLFFQYPEDHRLEFLQIWAQVAPRFADAPDTVIFEILNEPHDALNDVWGEYQLEALEIIRETNPDRTVILSGTDWGQAHGLADIVLPEDLDNIIVTFHHYGPFDFTHQGTGWTGLDLPRGRVFDPSNPDDLAAVVDTIEAAAAYGEEHGVPIFLGEYGAYDAADQESRIAWATTVRTEAQARGIATAWWEFNSGGFAVIFGPSGPVRDQELLDATQVTVDAGMEDAA